MPTRWGCTDGGADRVVHVGLTTVGRLVDAALGRYDPFWGLPVMYRYIGQGANPEPGLGTREKGDIGEWRKSWEWASLHEIREGVRTGRMFGQDDIIQHLLKWIRAGYAPTNPALKGTAHDGTDIGAVPWQAK